MVLCLASLGAPGAARGRMTRSASLQSVEKTHRMRRTVSEGSRVNMPKVGIHPKYQEIRVMCACGSNFATRSTHKGDLHVEICSQCHPFFTGKQKLIDTAGRLQRFPPHKAEKQPPAATETP